MLTSIAIVLGGGAASFEFIIEFPCSACPSFVIVSCCRIVLLRTGAWSSISKHKGSIKATSLRPDKSFKMIFALSGPISIAPAQKVSQIDLGLYFLST